MPDLWRTVSGMSADDFLAARDRFVAASGEVKRSGDARHFPESYSPLHRANPNMLPMTFEGIRLLHRWREDHPRRWHVPPLDPPASPARTVTLLELMPGAFLKAVGLPYKGYKKGRRASELREEITGALAAASGIGLPNLGSVRMGCHASDDFLDAVVAAVGAACWAQDAAIASVTPDRPSWRLARLEGWIYVPYVRNPARVVRARPRTTPAAGERASRSVDVRSVAFRPGGTVEGRRTVVARSIPRRRRFDHRARSKNDTAKSAVRSSPISVTVTTPPGAFLRFAGTAQRQTFPGSFSLRAMKFSRPRMRSRVLGQRASKSSDEQRQGIPEPPGVEPAPQLDRDLPGRHLRSPFRVGDRAVRPVRRIRRVHRAPRASPASPRAAGPSGPATSRGCTRRGYGRRRRRGPGRRASPVRGPR